MTPQDHARIKDLFLEAAKRPTDQRDAYLRDACGGDAPLRAEVERLLRHHRELSDSTRMLDDLQRTVPLPGGAPPAPASREKTPPPRGAPESLLLIPELAPGTVLGKRFRIVNRLGSGGMGDVYRAEDLKVRQAVALKFLPPQWAADRAWLARLADEVRVARSVTHPYLCRLHDLVTIGDRTFICMEYIDGEDLNALLRRVGRLPTDKAPETARQLCAAVAALHANNILHRDLKPANVMIDGNGQVHITDFGLARLSDDVPAHEIRAGTPAYMAPEQMAAREVTPLSDLYSMGMILYEIYTGRRPFEAEDFRGYLKLKQTTRPEPPSKYMPFIDPRAERVIMRCLEREPAMRPASALDAAVVLMGDDLLAATIAAGDLPSPQMIAATGRVTSVRWRTAVGWMAAFVALLAANLLLSPRVHPVARGLAPRPPEVLADHTRDLLTAAGFDLTSGAQAWGLADNDGPAPPPPGAQDDRPVGIPYVVEPPAAPIFWYRWSPSGLGAGNPLEVVFSGAPVTRVDPPLATSGGVLVTLAGDGRLVGFECEEPRIPRARSAHPAPPVEVMLPPLAEAAGLAPDLLSNLRARLTTIVAPSPPSGAIRFDTSLATTLHGASAGRRDPSAVSSDGDPAPVRVEAATGPNGLARLTLISMPRASDAPPGSDRIVRSAFVREILGAAALLLLVISVPLARHHLRSGGSDVRGGLRLAEAVIVVRLAGWFLSVYPPPQLVDWIGLILLALCGAVLPAVAVWLFYLALEPLTRRQWPTTLVAWTRILGGRLRDAAVGESLLCGAVFGAAWSIIEGLERWVPQRLGWQVREPAFLRDQFELYAGAGASLGFAIQALWQSVYYAVLILVFMTILRRIIGRAWPTLILTAALLILFRLPLGTHPTATLIAMIPVMGSLLWLMARRGLLAVVAAIFVAFILRRYPLTTDLQAWYAGHAMLALAMVGAVAGVGFWAARSRRDIQSHVF